MATKYWLYIISNDRCVYGHKAIVNGQLGSERRIMACIKQSRLIVLKQCRNWHDAINPERHFYMKVERGSLSLFLPNNVKCIRTVASINPRLTTAGILHLHVMSQYLPPSAVKFSWRLFFVCLMIAFIKNYSSLLESRIMMETKWILQILGISSGFGGEFLLKY